MADRVHTGISSSGNWWSTGRSTSTFDPPAMWTAKSFSCSTDHLITNAGSQAGGFNWSAEAACPINMLEAMSRPLDDSPGSNSSVTFQDVQTFSRPLASVATPAPMLDAAAAATAPCLLDFGLSSPTLDWNQSFFSSRTSGRGDQCNSFHSLFQEDVESQMQTLMESWGSSNAVLLKSMNQGSILHEEQQHVSSSGDNPPLFPSSLLQSMFAPAESRMQMSLYANQSPDVTYPVNCHEKFDDQAATLQVKPQPPPPLVKASQMKETPCWNTSIGAATEACSGFYHSAAAEAVQSESSGHSNLTGKPNSRARNSDATSEKTTGSQRVHKKARIETPSPLPTFKVRKEKLGDRITAIQQLVSPFGKTDTASVLHEAIDYINFLHDQVRALSVPYLKNDHQVQQVKGLDKSSDCEGRKQDLQSRGLCLVPISSTFVVANETPIDFWTPVFGGAYR